MTVIDLPKGWVITSVGEVATYQNGRAFKPSEWDTKGLPIIRIQNLNGTSSDYNFSNQRHEEKFRVSNGDLLFAWSASLGAYIWQGQEAWLNQHIFKVDHTKLIDRLFLYYALKGITVDLYTKAHGSGMVHVTKGKFEETPLRLPPLNEQRRIIAKIDELFSELDKGIESLETAREQLKNYRQAVLKQAFEGKLTAQWRERNKDKLEMPEQLLARIKREREMRYKQLLNEWKVANEEWESKGKSGKRPTRPKKLPQLTDIGDDLRTKLPQLPESWTWEKLGWLTCRMDYGTAAKSLKSGTVPVLRMGNIQNSNFDWTDLVYTSDSNEIDQYLLQDGDVLFNRTNSPELVGKSAIYKRKYPAIFAGYLIRLNHIRIVANSQYVNLFLNSPVARQYGNSVKTDGVNQSNINSTKLSNYPFPYCSVEEQEEIANCLEKSLSLVDETEMEIIKQFKNATELRQSILKQAFSGQLVAQKPNDEPASVLLARIRAAKCAVKSSAKA